MVPRARVRRRLRGDWRDASRRAGGGARPQPLHRLGRNQRRRRRRGSVSRAARSTPARTPSSAARRSRSRSSRKPSSSRARGRVTLNVRVTRHGPLVSDAINANNAASKHRAEAAAARAAGVPLDRARRRRLDGGGVPEAERGAQLGRVHRRASRLRRAVAELRLRRRRRPHRLLRARPHPDPRLRRRLDAGRRLDAATPSGPAGSRSTSCRTSTIRPSTSSSRRTTGRRRRHIRYLLGLEWPEPYRAQRINDLLSGVARRPRRPSSPPTTSRASRPTRCRCTRRRCCRSCSRTRIRTPGRSSRRSTLLQQWNGDAGRGQRAPRPSSAPGSISSRRSLAGDDLGAAGRSLCGALLVRHALRRADAEPQRQRAGATTRRPAHRRRATTR